MKVSRRWLSLMKELSFAEVFDRVLAKMGDSDFLYFYGRNITYGQFGERVKAWRGALHKHGFKKGDAAVVFSENIPQWCEVFFAVVTSGGAAVPLDLHLKGRQLAELVVRSEPKVIFTSKSLLPSVIEILNRCPSVELVVVMDGEGGEDKRVVGYEEFMSSSEPADIEELSPDSVCAILFTSGTTGDPKGVPLTHRNLLAGVAMSARFSGVHRGECVLNPLPLYHIFPLVAGFLVQFCCGMRLYLTKKIDRSDLNDAVKNRPISIMVCVPAFYEAMAARIKKRMSSVEGVRGKLIRWLTNRSLFSGYSYFLLKLKRLILGHLLGPWRKLRLLISGGAPLSDEAVRVFNSLGLPLLEGYGLTETCGGVIMNSHKYHRLGSVGRLSEEWVSVKIDNPDEDGVGEVLLRGPTVMEGYLDTPRSDSFDDDGYFMTGDVGYVDRDGYLFITGREKDVIVLATGKNVYPAELERHYSQSSVIKEICVFGVEDSERRRESVHAAVIVSDQLLALGDEAAYESLAAEIEKLSLDLPSYKRVKAFNIWKGKFPGVETTGKVKKFKVKQRVMAELDKAGDVFVISDDR